MSFPVRRSQSGFSAHRFMRVPRIPVTDYEVAMPPYFSRLWSSEISADSREWANQLALSKDHSWLVTFWQGLPLHVNWVCRPTEIRSHDQNCIFAFPRGSKPLCQRNTISLREPRKANFCGVERSPINVTPYMANVDRWSGTIIIHYCNESQRYRNKK